MKKVTYAVIAAMAMVWFASCKKEYHCECTYNNQLVKTVDLGNQTKSNAQKMCSVMDTTTIPGENLTCTIY